MLKQPLTTTNANKRQSNISACSKACQSSVSVSVLLNYTYFYKNLFYKNILPPYPQNCAKLF